MGKAKKVFSAVSSSPGRRQVTVTPRTALNTDRIGGIETLWTLTRSQVTCRRDAPCEHLELCALGGADGLLVPRPALHLRLQVRLDPRPAMALLRVLGVLRDAQGAAWSSGSRGYSRVLVGQARVGHARAYEHMECKRDCVRDARKRRCAGRVQRKRGRL